MKWYTIASSALAAAQLLTPAVATATCKTTYASTTTKSVPTSTVTKTSTLRKTKTTYATSTSTVIDTTTFTKTYASTTVTVPTSQGFTPIISASSIPTTSSSSSSRRRRDAMQERKAQRNGVNARPREAAGAQASSSKCSSSSSSSKSYPHNVGCTTTITRTQTTTTTSTFVIGQFTGVTKTTTTHVPTATAYAACGHDNIISYFHGHALADYAADHALGICGTGASGPQACLSAENCCAAAQRSGYSGFQFTNYTGASNTCTILAGGVIPNSNGHWAFYSGNGGDHAWFGNGAYNGGIFAGAHTE